MFRVFTLFLIGSLFANSYKILVYNPSIGHSHSKFLGQIADILAEAGHDVTSLVSVMDPHVSEETHLSKIIKVQPSDATSKLFERLVQTKTDMFTMNAFDPVGIYSVSKFVTELFTTQCKALLNEEGLVQKLKEEKFDVMFAEHFDMCGVGLFEVIKPRSLISVATSAPSGHQKDEFGIPPSHSSDPVYYSTKTASHSMWQRIVNIYGDLISRLAFSTTRTAVNELFKKKYGPSFPTMEQISSNSAYVFTNTEPLIDYALPSISKVIPIGGIGLKKPKKLTEDWERILSKRNQTVLFSFGSIAKSSFLPLNVKMSIFETMKALPHVTFIWKYEVDDDFTRDYASKVENIELTKWMPQVDLLAHPNLSLFITHGGMGSTQETALRGVPGVFIPLFGDQPRNAGMMEHNGLGKVLHKTEITNSAKFVEVIREVLENESYRSNARRVSAMLQKKPFTAKEQLIKYTEFAAQFGPSNALRPQSHDMNWIEYRNVDLIIAGIIVSLLSIVISFKIVQHVISKFITVKSKTD